ncbi:50S ribosomal protein L25/general stress protein Ctc [Schaalia turicensis]|uniref:50S ribosomal protein L25/general stress protein Ctc n=1 Tax=Schaalia turicensis TaxID=131111 RepID=UPI00189C5032|nr:50S ribosomal protein L25/general stress protein Ctc [Schaalia turicensis]
MSDNPILVATTRTEFGKGAARRARRAQMVPGVVYGHGETTHLDLPEHDLFLIVRGNKNALVELKIDGKSQLALVKDVQRHPVKRNLLHVDFLAVKAGEKVDVEVAIVVVGEAAPGTTHNVEEHTVTVKAPATDIPESIEVDVTGLEAGTVVRVSDLVLPANVECELDAEQDVVIISELVAEPEEEAPAEEAEGDAE